MAKIIGLLGAIGSGKDTAARILVEDFGFQRFSFASSLKDACAAIFGWQRELLEGNTEESRHWREQVDTWWAKQLDIAHFTPRWALQHIGTDIFRKQFHSDIWLLSVQRKLQNTDAKVVISDARFANEVNAVLESGGTIAEVRRGPKPDWWPLAIQASQDPRSQARSRLIELNIHESEWAWAFAAPGRIIHNDGTLEELYQKVGELARSDK